MSNKNSSTCPYNVRREMIEVSEDELTDFLVNYPRSLYRQKLVVEDITEILFCDPQLAKEWYYNAVAIGIPYSDDPDDAFYVEKEERVYYVMKNHEEAFESRIGKEIEHVDTDT